MPPNQSIDPVRQESWESKYRAGSTGWDRGAPSPALDRWLEGMPPGRVLVPGCGHGHEVGVLAHAGHAVTAVDIAPTPVTRLKAQLQQQGLQAEVLQADLLHWEPDAPFDTIYEQTCLCALEPSQWLEYEQRLARWLRSGGRLYVLFMQTGREGGPPFHCAMPDMRQLFDPERWQWPEEPDLDLPHPNGLHELAFVLVRR